jgi:putative metallohydrolase (TIGR04338 family)
VSDPPAPPVAADPAQGVYAAEETCVQKVGSLRRFRRFAEVGAYVEALVGSEWWDETFPNAPVEVDLHRRSSHATASLAALDGHVGVVALVDGHGWTLDVVLHELAHLAVGPARGHSERFRRALVELWRHEAGVEAAATLARELGIDLR